MTEEEFIKKVSELFMESFKQIPDKEKEDYLKSNDIREFMKDLYYSTCGDYELDGKLDAFSDEMLSQYPVHNLELYF